MGEWLSSEEILGSGGGEEQPSVPPPGRPPQAPILDRDGSPYLTPAEILQISGTSETVRPNQPGRAAFVGIQRSFPGMLGRMALRPILERVAPERHAQVEQDIASFRPLGPLEDLISQATGLAAEVPTLFAPAGRAASAGLGQVAGRRFIGQELARTGTVRAAVTAEALEREGKRALARRYGQQIIARTVAEGGVKKLGVKAATGAGMFAIADTVRDAAHQANEGYFSPAELLEAGVHGAAVGAALGPAQMLTKAAARIPAEAATFSIAGAALEGQRPTLADFGSATVLFALMGGLHGVPGAAREKIPQALALARRFARAYRTDRKWDKLSGSINRADPEVLQVLTAGFEAAGRGEVPFSEFARLSSESLWKDVQRSRAAMEEAAATKDQGAYTRAAVEHERAQRELGRAYQVFLSDWRETLAAAEKRRAWESENQEAAESQRRDDDRAWQAELAAQRAELERTLSEAPGQAGGVPAPVARQFAERVTAAQGRPQAPIGADTTGVEPPVEGEAPFPDARVFAASGRPAEAEQRLERLMEERFALEDDARFATPEQLGEIRRRMVSLDKRIGALTGGGGVVGPAGERAGIIPPERIREREVLEQQERDLAAALEGALRGEQTRRAEQARVAGAEGVKRAQGPLRRSDMPTFIEPADRRAVKETLRASGIANRRLKGMNWQDMAWAYYKATGNLPAGAGESKQFRDAVDLKAVTQIERARDAGAEDVAGVLEAHRRGEGIAGEEPDLADFERAEEANVDIEIAEREAKARRKREREAAVREPEPPPREQPAAPTTPEPEQRPPKLEERPPKLTEADIDRMLEEEIGAAEGAPAEEQGFRVEFPMTGGSVEIGKLKWSQGKLIPTRAGIKTAPVPTAEEALKFGESNTLVTRDEAAAILDRINKKLKGGIFSFPGPLADPELARDVVKFGVFATEAVARKLGRVAREAWNEVVSGLFGGKISAATLDWLWNRPPLAAYRARLEEKASERVPDDARRGEGAGQPQAAGGGAPRREPTQRPARPEVPGGAQPPAKVGGPRPEVVREGPRSAPRGPRGGEVPGDREDRVLPEDAPAVLRRERREDVRLPVDRPVELTPNQRIAANERAIAILNSKKPEEMTEADLDALRQYTGEGGLGEKAGEGQGSLTEYYTSYEIADWIWKKLDAMGWKGKKALEPAAGIGNFIGLGPKGVKFTAVEPETTSAKILQALYPSARVKQGLFQEMTGEEGTYDLVIGNPPFLEFWSGKSFEGAKPYRDIQTVHDMFIVKGLDQLKPGGVLAYVISTGSMDKLDTSGVRSRIAQQADLVAAYRLPSGIFEKNADFGGPVDVLFFQKRAQPRETLPAPLWLNASRMPEWEGAVLNDYFAENPRNVAGALEPGFGFPVRGGMRRLGVRRVAGDKFLERWLADDARLGEVRAEAPGLGVKAAYKPPTGSIPAPEGVWPGRHIVRSGKVYRTNTRGFAEPWTGTKALSDRVTTAARATELLDAITEGFRGGARDKALVAQVALRKLLDEHIGKHGPFVDDAKLMEVMQDDPYLYHLRELVREDGTYADIVTKPTVFANPYRRDAVDYSDVDALAKDLEIRDGSVDPAVAWSLYKGDKFKSPEALAAHFKNAPDWNRETIEIRDEEGKHVAHRPTGRYVHDRQFLYGDVRAKEARAEALGMKEEARKLREVFPPQRTAKDMRTAADPAARWVDKSVIQEFGQWFGGREYKLEKAFDRWGEASRSSNFRDRWKPEIERRIGGEWVTLSRGVTIEDTPENRERYGPLANGKRYEAPEYWDEIIETALNGRVFEVRPATETYRGRNAFEAKVLNERILPQVRETFQRWLGENAEALDRMTKDYNWAFRSWRDKTYPSEAQIDGFSTAHFKSIHPWQGLFYNMANDLGRAVNSTDTGGGKTLSLILVGQGLRQSGRAKKVLYVVPPGVLEKWKAEYQLAFPGARILDLGNLSTSKENVERTREILARAKLNDYDAFFMSRTGIANMPMSPAYRERFLLRKQALLEEALANAPNEFTKRETKKQVERIKAMIDKIRIEILAREEEAKANLGTQPHYFDELGFDALIVDEAHEFKNAQVIGSQIANQLGIGGSDAGRAMDMQMKAEYVLGANGNRNVFMASASPTPNQPTDIFNMLSLVVPDRLERQGLGTMDSFLSHFFDTGMIDTIDEGGNPKSKVVVTDMKNLNDLRELFHGHFYFRTAEQLRDQFPDYKYEKPRAALERIILPPTPATEVQLGKILQDIQNLRALDPIARRKERGRLQMAAIGVAVGPGILEPGKYADYRHPDFKLERAANLIAKNYQALLEAPRRPTGGRMGPDLNGHIVFLDAIGASSVRGPVMKQNYHRWLKARLIEHGIPAHEIEIINANENASAADKYSVSRRFNSGKVRVVIGSTGSMGVGIDLHKIATHLYELDIPWNPELSRQRAGRAVRQGNLGDFVQMYQFLTDRTFDAKRSQINLTKSNFLEQFLFGSEERMRNQLSTAEVENMDLGELTQALKPARAQLAVSSRTYELEFAKQELASTRGDVEANERNAKKIQEELAERTERIADLKRRQLGSKQEGAYQTQIDREVHRVQEIRETLLPGIEKRRAELEAALPSVESLITERTYALDRAVKVNRLVTVDGKRYEDAENIVAFESYGVAAPKDYSTLALADEVARLGALLPEKSTERGLVESTAEQLRSGQYVVTSFAGPETAPEWKALRTAWKNLYGTELKVGPRSVGSAGARPSSEQPKARRRTGTLADGAVDVPAAGRELTDAEQRILTRGGAPVDRARQSKLGQGGATAEDVEKLSQAERVVHVIRRVGAARDPVHIERILRAPKYKVWSWEDADVELVLTAAGERLGEQDVRRLSPEMRRFVRRLDSDAPRGAVSRQGLNEGRALRWVFGLFPARTALRGTGIVERMRSSYESLKREFNLWVDYSERELWIDDRGKHIRPGSADDKIIFQLVNNAEADARWLERPTVRLLDGSEHAPKDWHRRVARELAEIFDELRRAQGLEPERTRKFYITNIVDRVLAFEPATKKDLSIVHALARLKVSDYEFAELARKLPADLSRAKALQIMDYLRSDRSPRTLKGVKRGLDVILGADERSTIPDELYQPYLKRRYGNLPPIESAHLAFETYLRYALRKVHLEPAVESIKPIVESMPGENLSIGPLAMSQREYASRYIDRILGRPTGVDVALERWAETLNEATHGKLLRVPIVRGLFRPKPATRATSALLRAQYLRLLGLAVDSAITNLTQGINTLTRFGLRDAFAGYLRLLDPRFRKLIRDEHLLQEFQSFYRGPESPFARPLSKIEKLALSPFTFAELINRGAAFAAGIQRGKRLGLSAQESLRLGHGRVSEYLAARRPEEARRAGYTSPLLEYARAGVIETQFGYSPVEGSPAFGTPGGRTFFQFFSYPTQQVAMLYEGIRRRELAREAGLGELAWLRYLALLGFTTVAGNQLAQFLGLDAANLFSVWGVVPTGPGPNVQLGLDLWSAIPSVTGGRETMSSRMAKARLEYGYAPRGANPLTLTRFGKKYFTREGPYRFLPVAPAELPHEQRRKVRRMIRRQVDR